MIFWLILLFGVGLGAIIWEGANTDLWIPGLIGLLLSLVGIWMVGMTTKAAFNQLLGHITIARGHVPLFLWFLRTKRISREEARSVFVDSIQRWVYSGGTTGGRVTVYAVKVITSLGKKPTLYDGGNSRGAADYLAKRILDFAQETEVELRSGVKFSMRVEEAFQATFTSGALGMVVGGTVEQGTIRNEDEVEIRGYQGTKRAKVFEVDTLKGSAAPDERVRLLIEDLTEDDVKLGDIVERV